MYAARQGSLDAAKALLDSGANIDAASADKSTALLFATINAHFDLAKLLVDRGANPNLASVDGAAPLYGVANTQWARHTGYPQPSIKYERVSYLELMKALLDRGADPNARAGFGDCEENERRCQRLQHRDQVGDRRCRGRTDSAEGQDDAPANGRIPFSVGKVLIT